MSDYAVDDLALQVRLVDDVEVDDADRADAGRGQVQQRRRTEPAGADHQHPRVFQPLLPVDAQVGNDQVPAVAGDLVAGQLGGGSTSGGNDVDTECLLVSLAPDFARIRYIHHSSCPLTTATPRSTADGVA